MSNAAIIYARVSSKEQEETGYSLDSQVKLLNEYGERKSLKIKKIFKITESASGKFIRKTFTEMLQYAEKNNINIILCEKIDRLTRNLRDAGIVSEWLAENKEREVHFVKENFVVNQHTRAHENLVWDMKVAIARFYINNLSEEVRKGQKEKLSQGWLPTKPPLGYITIGEKGHKIHIIDETKAPMIRKMFELYSTGNYSTYLLVEIMYEAGLRNQKGGKVGKSRMYDLLSDPFYCGKMRWKDVVSQGKQDPIVSEELFDVVQNKLNRKFTQPQHKKHLPVFKAKMTCIECEGTITWEIQKGHWYCHCSRYQKRGQNAPCSQKKWFRQEVIEDKLFPILGRVTPKSEKVLRILEKALKEDHADEIARTDEKRDRITADLERAERRLEKIYEDKIDGNISPTFYETKFAEYTAQKDIALKDIKMLSDDKTKYYEAGYKIHELASRAADIYKNKKTKVDDKRLLLSYAFSNLALNAEEIRPEYTLAFQFLSVWMPKVNSIFEPENSVVNKGKEEPFDSSHPIMLRG